MVERDPAASHDAVQTRVMVPVPVQVLLPGVQHGDGADLGAEMARIGGDRTQCFGSSP